MTQDGDTQSFHDAGRDPHERSRFRWRRAAPRHGLTWGKEVTGEAFIAKAEQYGAFAPENAILEIGPGYGRLLREAFRRGLPFREYVGVDVSAQNAAHLRAQFGREDVHILLGDIESIRMDRRFDAVLSSLTFKHLYPSFETALRNVKRHLNDTGVVIFDLLEGDQAGFLPPHHLIFLRAYSRAEVAQVLSNIELELVSFDDIQHDSEHTRLLVVARKIARVQ